MAEVRLWRPCVVTFVGQRVTAGVPQHVRVSLEGESGFNARTLDHACEARRGVWRAAL